MGTVRLLAAASLMFLFDAADASAALRNRHHPGHQPRLSTATYTVHSRPLARTLRTVHHAGPTAHVAQGRTRGTGGIRLAQVTRHHPLMRGS